jgi:hypothetical protein
MKTKQQRSDLSSNGSPRYAFVFTKKENQRKSALSKRQDVGMALLVSLLCLIFDHTVEQVFVHSRKIKSKFCFDLSQILRFAFLVFRVACSRA